MSRFGFVFEWKDQLTGIKALRSEVETVMDPRNENTSLEQRDGDAVGHEVTSEWKTSQWKTATLFWWIFIND